MLANWGSRDCRHSSSGLPLDDASVPRDARTLSTARVTSSSMGECSPHEGGSPGQWQVEGQRPGVETSGYGENHRSGVSGPAGGRGRNHASDSHDGG